MRNLETNNWVYLNDLIYHVYATDDLERMRLELLENMKALMDYDAADFWLASPDNGNYLQAPVCYNYVAKQPHEAMDADSAHKLLFSGKSLVCRESDILPEEKRVQTSYYKRVYQDNHFHFGIQLILALNGHFLGVATFYRETGKPDFDYGDIFLLDMLKEHLSYRIFRDMQLRVSGARKMDVSDAVRNYGLTRREHMILELLVEGEENADICEKLTISPNTLKKHILNIYRKLGINNRVQMYRMIRQK